MFPTIYKRVTNGIQYLDIYTEGNSLITEHGLLHTSNTQTSRYPYEEINLGKSNYMTAEEHAESAAKSKFDKLIKYNGYSTDINNIDKVLYFKPMKAFDYIKQKKKLILPCYAQPKLNGMRCIATIVEGEVTLTTGLGNIITTMPHIIQAIKYSGLQNCILDGELYSHGMPLNDILGIVKANVNMYKDTTRESIEYHVFDLIEEQFMESPFKLRHYFLNKVSFDDRYIKKVPTKICNDEAELDIVMSQWVGEGYEGAIYRNMNGVYENKRSYNILKRKDFKDDEFLIVEANEGSGALEGCVASFTCRTKDNLRFNCPMNGTREYLAELFSNRSLWEYKWLTVKYLELSKYGIPQIPKGLQIRDKRGGE